MLFCIDKYLMIVNKMDYLCTIRDEKNNLCTEGNTESTIVPNPQLLVNLTLSGNAV